jgi:hypothetical protein
MKQFVYFTSFMWKTQGSRENSYADRVVVADRPLGSQVDLEKMRTEIAKSFGGALSSELVFTSVNALGTFDDGKPTSGDGGQSAG